MHNDGANVILTPISICHVNQRITYLLRASFLTEYLGQFWIVYHFPEPIRTEQQRVTGAQGLVEDIDFDVLMSCPKRTVDEISLGVGIDVLRVDLLRLHQPGDQ